MDGLWGQYGKWNKSERDKWAHVSSHLHIESKTVELIFWKFINILTEVELVSNGMYFQMYSTVIHTHTYTHSPQE